MQTGIEYFANDVAVKAYRDVLPARFNSKSSLVMLMAIGLQESLLVHRKQIGGPARGAWQFEKGGGVVGTMKFATTKNYLKAVCSILGVPFDASAIYNALETNDVLAFCLARLYLWTDSRSLPEPKESNADQAAKIYFDVWRPGSYWRGDAEKRKQLTEKFISNYKTAVKALA